VPSLTVLDRLWRRDGQVSQNPKDVAALLGRSQELSEAQQFRLAQRDVEAALAIDPKNSAARAAKVATYAKLGEFEQAAAELRELETMKPPRELLAQALSSVVDAALAASQLDLALDLSDKLINAKPEAHYYKQRAAILQRLERYSDAQEDLARAQQLEKEKTP
jgi:tetratricopeptide (TPR) repeat protein